MPYTPTRSDATAVATDTIARLNTNPSPNAGASLKDATVALQDSMLCAVGYQAQDVATTNISLTTTTYTAVWASYTFVAPIAKTYLVHVDVIGWYLTAFGLGGNTYGSGLWKLQNNGADCQPTDLFTEYDSAASHLRSTLHFISPVVCIAGNNVLQLMWKAGEATTTLGASTGNDKRIFTITG